MRLIGKPNTTISGTPIESMVEWIAAAYKGSYDIAGAALALERAGLAYVWSNDGSAFVDARSRAQLYDARMLCCFEFVHLASYLAGRQQVANSGNPMVSGAAATVYSKRKYKVWDGSSIIPRNKIVVGVARAFNNQSGFYHVGGSLGDGRVVSLSGGSGIHSEPTGGLFGILYSEVQIGDYPWAQAQNDGAAPPPPP